MTRFSPRLFRAAGSSLLWLPCSLVLLGIPSCPTDEDGDGWTSDDDCNDADPYIYPGAPEVCDGVDNDCDAALDEGLDRDFYLDEDNDFYGQPGVILAACERPKGYAPTGDDCDDGDREVHPDADEACDGEDNDCDGQVDEDSRPAYRDMDGDGFGRTAEMMAAPCTAPAGYVRARGDCDDGVKSFHPGAVDGAGDGKDQDCGGADGPQPSVGLEASGYTTVQAALDAAVEGVTVWVGPGEYPEAELSFRGKAVTLISSHGAEATTLRGNAEWGSVVVFDSGEGPDTVLDGFTVTGGRSSRGGGLYLEEASPVLRDLIVRDNGRGVEFVPVNPQNSAALAFGGGLYMDKSDALLERCVIRDNIAGHTDNVWNGYDLRSEGGGVYMQTSSPVFVDCRITGNMAYAVQHPNYYYKLTTTYGGGFYSDYGSSPKFHGCRFARNRGVAESDDPVTSGGGAYIASSQDGAAFRNCVFEFNESRSGGGIFVDNSSARISNSILRRNFATYGGGMDIYRAYKDYSVSILNSMLFQNVAAIEGGGLYISYPDVFISSSVIIGNVAPRVGGISTGGSLIEEVMLEVTASILAYNSDYNLFMEPGFDHYLNITYSDLYNPPGEFNHNISLLSEGTMMNEPGFLEYDDFGRPSDLHLSSVSMLIDAGVPSILDVDESRSDMGAFGGPEGDDFDLDLDGFPNWFWPGTIHQVPVGFYSFDYDRSDLDPALH